MTQNAYAYSDQQKQADAELAFKRFILEKTLPFERTPKADLFRVALLGLMFDRYDGFLHEGLTAETARERTRQAFYDIPQRMEEAGFDRVEHGEWQENEDSIDEASDWPQLSEHDAAEFIEESKKHLKGKSRGIVMILSFMLPVFLATSLADLFLGLDDIFMGTGLAVMVGLIALGVGSLVLATKPEKQEQVKAGHFSLTVKLRKKLEDLLELMEKKCRRRRSRGLVLLICSVIPMIGASIMSDISFYYSDFWFGMGMTGMLGMIAASLYQLFMSKETKSIEKLLKR